MKDVILILLAAGALRDRASRRAKGIVVGTLLMFFVLNIFIITNTKQEMDYSSSVLNYLNILNFSSFYILGFGNIYRNNKENINNDFLQFAVHLPVSKKSVSMARFALVWIGMLPALAVLLYQNIICYFRELNGFSGYIGFCTILFCCHLLIFSAICGFNPYISPRNIVMIILYIASIIVVLITSVSIFASLGLNNEHILYGMYGVGFSGIFAKLEILSGRNGSILVVLSIIISFCLCSVIPERIFIKKGWSV